MLYEGGAVKSRCCIFVSGPPASGKSTLGRALASHLGAVYLDLDTISEPFIGPLLRHRPDFKDSSTYEADFRSAEYKAVLKCMRENLIIGNTCIVAAPFRLELDTDDFPHAWLKGIDAVQSVGVLIRISAESQLDNMKKRFELRDQEKIQNWETFHEYYSRWYQRQKWGMDHDLVIDFHDLTDSLDKVVQRIGKELLTYN